MTSMDNNNNNDNNVANAAATAASAQSTTTTTTTTTTTSTTTTPPTKPTTTTTTTTDTSTTTKKTDDDDSIIIKTVYLIRHAESEENRRIASFNRCLGKLRQFQLPKSSDVTDSTELLNINNNLNTPVSNIGKKQINYMKTILQTNNFVSSSKIELIVHSPLQRARDTCEGLLGYVGNNNNSSSSKEVSSQKPTTTTTTTLATTATAADKVEEEGDATTTTTGSDSVQHHPRVVEQLDLSEKTPQEWVPMCTHTFKQRILKFEYWLSTQPEQIIAIVGHSQYFKAMLGLDYKFGNCDVYRITFQYNNNNHNNNRNTIDSLVPDSLKSLTTKLPSLPNNKNNNKNTNEEEVEKKTSMDAMEEQEQKYRGNDNTSTTSSSSSNRSLGSTTSLTTAPPKKWSNLQLIHKCQEVA